MSQLQIKISTERRRLESEMADVLNELRQLNHKVNRLKTDLENLDNDPEWYFEQVSEYQDKK